MFYHHYCFVLPFFLSSVSAIVRPALDCPEGFAAVGDECLFFSAEPRLNFNVALADCISRGSTLLEHHSRQEIDLARHYINLTKPVTDWWIGAVETGVTTDEFIWMSTGAPMVYTDWHSNQPDDPEQCAVIIGWGYYQQGIDNQQGDYPLHLERSYICEAPALSSEPSNTRQPSISPELACPDPFFAVGDQCFLLEKGNLLTWEDARTACQGYGGYLAELGSRAEVEIVKYWLMLKHPDCTTFSVGDIWLGGVEEGETNLFQWARSGNRFEVTDWNENEGEPGNPGKADTVALRCSANFQWQDLVADGLANFLCEADPLTFEE